MIKIDGRVEMCIQGYLYYLPTLGEHDSLVRPTKLPRLPADFPYVPKYDRRTNCVRLVYAENKHCIKAMLCMQQDETCILIFEGANDTPVRQQHENFDVAWKYLEAVLLLDIQPD
jgi:hypothetical protein